MQTTTRTFALLAALAGLASIGLAPPAFAKHHHKHMAKAALVPAHLKPGYVGAPGYPGGAPGPRMPGLVDVGLGPVFPFSGI